MSYQIQEFPGCARSEVMEAIATKMADEAVRYGLKVESLYGVEGWGMTRGERTYGAGVLVAWDSGEKEMFTVRPESPDAMDPEWLSRFSMALADTINSSVKH